jgi:hypothetical protein
MSHSQIFFVKVLGISVHDRLLFGEEILIRLDKIDAIYRSDQCPVSSRTSPPYNYTLMVSGATYVIQSNRNYQELCEFYRSLINNPDSSRGSVYTL